MLKSILVIFAFVLFSSSVFADMQTCRINGNFAGVKSHSEWMDKTRAVAKKTAAQKQYPGVKYTLACKKAKNILDDWELFSSVDHNAYLTHEPHFTEHSGDWSIGETPHKDGYISGPTIKHVEWDRLNQKDRTSVGK